MNCPACGGELSLVTGAGRCESCGWGVHTFLKRILGEFESAQEETDSRRKEVSLWHLYGCGSGSAQTLLELGLLNEEEWVKWIEALGAAAGFESEWREASSEASSIRIEMDDDQEGSTD